MKKEIQGVVFDIGGVLIEDSTENFLKKFSKDFNVSKQELANVIKNKVKKLQKGKETDIQFWKDVFEVLKINSIPNYKLEKLWSDGYVKFSPIKKDTLKIVRYIHRRRIKLGIISNTINTHIREDKKRNIYDLFDVLVLSPKVGERKPDEKIYNLASEKMKLKPDNLLFIDNEKKYVDAARKNGWQAHHFKNAEELKKFLDNIL